MRVLCDSYTNCGVFCVGLGLMQAENDFSLLLGVGEAQNFLFARLCDLGDELRFADLGEEFAKAGVEAFGCTQQGDGHKEFGEDFSTCREPANANLARAGAQQGAAGDFRLGGGEFAQAPCGLGRVQLALLNLHEDVDAFLVDVHRFLA